MGVAEEVKVEEKAAEKEPAAKAEEQAAEVEQEEPEEPAVPPGYVPIRALQDERLKRQEAERRLAETATAAKPVEEAKPQQYTDDELDALEEDARSTFTSS